MKFKQDELDTLDEALDDVIKRPEKHMLAPKKDITYGFRKVDFSGEELRILRTEIR